MNVRKLLGAAWVLAVLHTAGCYQQTYVVSDTTPDRTLAHREWNHYLLAGLVPLSGDVELRSVCPQGIARIDSGINALHVFLTAVTFFVYAPSSTEVWCAATLPDSPASPIRIIDHPVDSGTSTGGAP